MNDKKIVKILIIAIMVIFILSCTIITILIKSNKENIEEEEYYADPPMVENPIEIEEKLEKVSNRNNFYMVKTAVNDFLKYCSEVQEETKVNNSIEAINAILDDEYIKKKGITKENLKNSIGIKDYEKFIITEMYESQQNENITNYFVCGKLFEKKSNEVENFSMIVRVDMVNRTYKILLEDYINGKFGGIPLDQKIYIDKKEYIDNNKYNVLKFKVILDEEYIQNIISTFKDKIFLDVEEAYNTLYKDYREKRFGSVNDFKKYINQNNEEINNFKVSQYKKERYEGYIQYICIDDKGKIVIINETSPMQYSIILDTYTIDLPEFIEKYDSSNNEQKAILNAEKIKNAINDKNYEYVYSKLNSNFKNNKFNKYNQFIVNFSSKFFENNTFEYKNVEQEGDIFAINILVKDNKTNSSKNRTIIMRLLENRDFEISYDIDQ